MEIEPFNSQATKYVHVFNISRVLLEPTCRS